MNAREILAAPLVTGVKDSFKTRIINLFFPIFAALISVIAANTGAFYYLMDNINIKLRNPIFLYAPLVLVAIFALKMKIHILQLFFVIVAILFTVLWSPSHEYLNQKIVGIIVVPILFYLTGCISGKISNIIHVPFIIFSFLVLIVVKFNGLDDLVFSGDLTFDYQRFAIIMGSCAGLCILSGSYRGLILALVFSYYTVVSGGRTGVLLIMVSGLVYASFYNKKLFYILALLILPSYYFFTELILFASDMLQLETFDRAVQASIGIEDPMAWTRQALGQSAWFVFQSHPLIGVGWAGFPVTVGLADDGSVYPHNIVLEMLAETGLIGAVIFFSWMSRIVWKASTLPDTQHKRMAIGLFAIALAKAMFVDDLPSQPFIFFALGILSYLNNSSESKVAD